MGVILRNPPTSAKRECICPKRGGGSPGPKLNKVVTMGRGLDYQLILGSREVGISLNFLAL
ncbi:MAG: hypothetical protein AB1324_07985 [Candidatus Micrarchaeota archaeon]